jgi:hypothetical protein
MHSICVSGADACRINSNTSNGSCTSSYNETVMLLYVYTVSNCKIHDGGIVG